MKTPDHFFTQSLRRIWKADNEFCEQLRNELRQQAAIRLSAGVRAISASSLVQESILRLLSAKCLERPKDRRHLYALAAQAMRYVIVDHIRYKSTRKRKSNFVEANLDLLVGIFESQNLDPLEIHEGLEQLQARKPRQAQVVDMKFFAGYKMPEIAKHLGVGLSTVENDWTEAKQFLLRFLAD